MTETTTNPELDAWREMAHKVAREFFAADFRAKNEGATKEDVAEAWKGVASDYRKVTKTALKRLEKQGITLTATTGS